MEVTQNKKGFNDNWNPEWPNYNSILIESNFKSI